MIAAMNSAAVYSAAMNSAAMDSAAMDSAAMDSTAVAMTHLRVVRGQRAEGRLHQLPLRVLLERRRLNLGAGAHGRGQPVCRLISVTFAPPVLATTFYVAGERSIKGWVSASRFADW